MPSLTNLNVRSIKQISFFGTPWKDTYFQVEYILKKNIMQQKLTDLTKAVFFFFENLKNFIAQKNRSVQCAYYTEA